MRRSCPWFFVFLLGCALFACDIPLGAKRCTEDTTCRPGWRCSNAGVCEPKSNQFTAFDDKSLPTGWQASPAGLAIKLLPTYQGAQSVLQMQSTSCGAVISPPLTLPAGSTISARLYFPEDKKTPPNCYTIRFGALVGADGAKSLCDESTDPNKSAVLWAVTLRLGLRCQPPSSAATMSLRTRTSPQAKSQPLPAGRGWHLLRATVTSSQVTVAYGDAETPPLQTNFSAKGTSGQPRLFINFRASAEIQTGHVDYIQVEPPQ